LLASFVRYLQRRSSNLRTALTELSAALLALCVFSVRAEEMDQDLIAAAGNGDLAGIAALLKKGANVRARTSISATRC
jgi:hypothetical protein